MAERFAVQMRPKKTENEMIQRVYKEPGIRMASRILKLILDDVKELDDMGK